MAVYLVADEVADLVRVKTNTVYKWVCDKSIPSTSAGGRTLFDKDEILAWVESRKRTTIRAKKLV